MGGTVKWTIGEIPIKLALLSMFYVFFAFLLQLVKEIEAMAKQEVVSSFVNLVIIVAAFIFDLLFLSWIVLSLIRTMQQLTLRRQQLKLEMYKAFCVVIGVAATLSILMIVYQAYLNELHNPLVWQNQWITGAYWELLYFGLILAIAFLWRPPQNNTRSSYAEFLEGADEDNGLDDSTVVQLETLTFLGGGGDVMKKPEDGVPSSPSPNKKDDEKKPTRIDPADRVRQASEDD
jgi:hypothetical protein